MATTTNYGWTTPDDTALVKDGAAAIRTLGSSIDTTTKNLNPSTTLGDIEYRSSTANTNTRLPIGTNGQYLTISGGVPAWGGISAGGMTLLSTTTLSGTAVTISSIPGTYKNLQILIHSVNAGSAYTLTIKPQDDGPDTIMYLTLRGTSFTSDQNSGQFGSFGSSNTGLKNVYLFTIYDYANTVYKNATISGAHPTSSGDARFLGTGAYNDTPAISSLTIRSTVSMTSGTCLIYGVS